MKLSIEQAAQELERLRAASTWGELAEAAERFDLPVLDEQLSWQFLENLGGDTSWTAYRLMRFGRDGTVRQLLASRRAERSLEQDEGPLVRAAVTDSLRDLLYSRAREFTVSEVSQRERDAMEDEKEALGLGGLDLPADRSLLRRWADHFGVKGHLERGVGGVIALDGNTAANAFLNDRQAREQTIEDILTAPTSRGRSWRRGVRSVPFQVQESCRDFLFGEALSRRIAAALPPQRLRRPEQADPRLQQLWDRWHEALDQCRTESGGRSKLQRSTWSLRVTGDPPRLVYTEASPGCIGAQRPRISIDLRGSAAEEIVSCSCTQGGPALRTCALRVSALEAGLELLEQQRPARAYQAIVEEVARPSWDRVVAGLDATLKSHARRREETLPVGWRVDVEDDGHRLRPVEVTQGEGRVRTRLVKPATLLSEPHRLHEDGDHFTVQLLNDSVGHGKAASDSPSTIARALLALAGHPRMFLGSHGARLRVRRAELTMRWRREGEDLCVDVVIGDRVVPPHELATLAWAGSHGAAAYLLDPRRRSCLVAPVQPEAAALLTLLAQRGSRFADNAEEPFLDRLHAIEQILPVELSDELSGRQVPGDDRLRVRLESLGDGGLSVALRVKPLADGPSLRPGHGARAVYGHDAEGRLHVPRDLGAELRRAGELAARLDLDREDGEVPDQVVDDVQQAVALLDRMTELGDAVVMEWRGAASRVLNAHSGGQVRLTLRPMEQWFGVDGTVSADGLDVPLQAVLDAIHGGRRYLRVGDRDLLRIGDDLARDLARATSGAFQQPDGLVISPLHAAALDELRELGADVDGPEGWLDSVEALRGADSINTTLPAGLDAQLRDYQGDGYAWMLRLASWAGGACLADDMGLGKTLQALAVLLQRRALGPALVVAPTSLSFNWIREAKRFAPTLRVREYRGRDRAQVLAELSGLDVLITSWSLAARDIDELEEIEFSTVVFDEAQAIKNPNTGRSKAARRLRAAFRLALTGTPVENNAEELWSLFGVLLPGLLGSLEQFRARYAQPIAAGDEEAQLALARMIRPFVLRRLKSQVARQLPSRSEIELRVELDAAERERYERERHAALARLRLAQQDTEEASRLRFQALADLTRLRQLACHPQLVDPDAPPHSAKLLRVRRLVTDLRAEGHQVLVFSQFVRHLTIVRRALERDGALVRYLDGSTPPIQRQREVDLFQAGQGDVFCVSLKAGGTGLNLTAASYVVHLDPWWNPAVEDQATDRAHRIGQDKPVTVYRLVAAGTVEEQIVALHATKRELAAALLTGTGKAVTLGVDDLVELIASGGESNPDWEELPTAPPPPTQVVTSAAELPPPPPVVTPTRSLRYDELVDPFVDWLEAQVVSGTISKAATARSYSNVARALGEWFAHRDVVEGDFTTWKGELPRLEAAVKEGGWDTPRTVRYQGGTVLRKMEKWATGRG